MSLKTIHDLNQRIWYRGLKIVMVGFILLFMITGIVDTYVAVDYDYSTEYTRITCKRSGRDGFVPDYTDLKKMDLFASGSATPVELYNAGIKYCALTEKQAETMISADLSNEGSNPSLNCSGNESGLMYCGEYMTLSNGVIMSYYPIGRNVLTLTTFFVIGIVILEVARRLFYYLMLGSFLPKKE